MIRYGHNLKKLNIKKIKKDINDKLVANKSKKMQVEDKGKDSNAYGNYDEVKGRIAVYTCITGKYDNLQVPLVRLENVDYYLITDMPERYKGFAEYYKIIKLPKAIMQKGNIEANRFVKFHPHVFFDSYDYSMYIDGNVRIVSNIRDMVGACNCVTGIAMHLHRERNCLYKEAEICKKLKRGNKRKIDAQIKRYKKSGFPVDYGMNEATIIACDLNNIHSKQLLNDWWHEFIRSRSMRDQLAWPYVLWKNGYKISDVGNLGDDIYKNYKIEIVHHVS